MSFKEGGGLYPIENYYKEKLKFSIDDKVWYVRWDYHGNYDLVLCKVNKIIVYPTGTIIYHTTDGEATTKDFLFSSLQLAVEEVKRKRKENS